MQAIIIQQPGGSEQLTVGDVPMLEPADDQLLVRVRATAVNRADIMQRQGFYPAPAGASEILGLEMAGDVVASGERCLQFQKGDRVFGLLDGGGYAEYALISENMAMLIPENIGFDQMAAVPEVFLTAYQALIWHAKLRPNETVLIHAGASGVGTAAIQLAKSLNCRVIVTASCDRKLNACTALGADFGINYTEQNFTEEVLKITEGAGANVIIDFIGAAYLEQNLSSIAMDGRLILLALLGGYSVDQFNILPLVSKRVTMIASTLRSRDQAYKVALTRAFSDDFLGHFGIGKLKAVVDRKFNIDQVTQAHDYMESNQNIGKIVLTGF